MKSGEVAHWLKPVLCNKLETSVSDSSSKSLPSENTRSNTMRSSPLYVLVALCAAATLEAQQRESPIASAFRGPHRITAESERRAEMGTISGVITEAASTSPVAGARVGIAGMQIGAVTGADGRYPIGNVPAGSHTLQVRMIGYTMLERIVTVVDAQVATANFQLSTRAVVLDAVVAVGYGTQKRGSLTGAVDQVGAAALENRPQ